MGERSTDAARRNDQAKLFRIQREMQGRGTRGRRDVGRLVAGNLEEEKEAWRTHFKKVSEGRGEVPEGVWQNVTGGDGVAEWLSKCPSEIELDRCVAAIKNRKAAGADKVVAEVIKYGEGSYGSRYTR